MSVSIRAILDTDYDAVHALLLDRWTGASFLLDGEVVDASRLPGFIAKAEGETAGLVTLIKREREWEILTLDSLSRWQGTGTLLLNAVITDAREAGIKRVLVRTSNDNLDAFRFYQRRGFRLEKIAQGVIDEERELKPEIPLVGDYGIEIHDEVTFARAL